jgi:hypothetical protein
VEISEVVNYRLCRTASTRPSLDYLQFLGCWVRVITLMGSLEVTGNCHPVIGLEYLAGGQPGIGRVLLGQLPLIIIVPNQRLEIYGRLEFPDLEI